MFEGEKLDIIKSVAERVKNQGDEFHRSHPNWRLIDRELTVYHAITLEPGAEKFTQQEINIIKFCAEECKRQRSGEMSVYWMIYAWNAAQKEFTLVNPPPFITIDSIEYFGKLVEPYRNAHGIRHRVGDIVGISDGFQWIEKAPPDRVKFQLETLIEAYYEDEGFIAEHPLAKTSEDQFYYAFEEIHPFMDGNGRTGKIIYNYLKGTLDNPVMPPNFFGGSNP